MINGVRVRSFTVELSPTRWKAKFARMKNLAEKTEARLFGELDDQAAAVTERRVIVPPVGHPMPLPGNVTASLRMLFERHD